MKFVSRILLLACCLLIFSEPAYLATEAEDKSNLVCANAYNEEMRKEEHVRCVTLDVESLIEFRCNLIKSYGLQVKFKADVIRSKLVIQPAQNEVLETVFFWERDTDEARLESKTYLKNNATLPLSPTSNNESFSEILLYDIKIGILYKICVMVIIFIFILEITKNRRRSIKKFTLMKQNQAF